MKAFLKNIFGTKISPTNQGSDSEFSRFFPGEFVEDVFAFAHDGVKEIPFLLLQGDDFLFDGAFGDELVHVDRTRLPDAMRAVYGLVLDARVPPRVEDNDCIGGGEIEPGSAGLETDEKNGDVRVAVKLVNHLFL